MLSFLTGCGGVGAELGRGMRLRTGAGAGAGKGRGAGEPCEDEDCAQGLGGERWIWFTLEKFPILSLMIFVLGSAVENSVLSGGRGRFGGRMDTDVELGREIRIGAFATCEGADVVLELRLNLALGFFRILSVCLNCR